ncbi:MAG: DUF4160 domain-containing protein [Deltaproteobacteria bacterium]|nr:DUF4160 domain-containing protein [Deltaproteobacteria bacterium]
MPIVLRYKGYSFFFFSNEGNPIEPLHIHVRKGDAIAKFWIKPAVGVAHSHGLNSNELTELLGIVEENKKLIERSWHEYFGD